MNVQLLIQWIRSSSGSRYVRRGRVNCPQRGDIDVDMCAGCPDLLAIEDGRVSCSFRPTARIPAPDVYPTA